LQFFVVVNNAQKIQQNESAQPTNLWLCTAAHSATPNRNAALQYTQNQSVLYHATDCPKPPPPPLIFALFATSLIKKMLEGFRLHIFILCGLAVGVGSYVPYQYLCVMCRQWLKFTEGKALKLRRFCFLKECCV
jgi:hypothetical protein